MTELAVIQGDGESKGGLIYAIRAVGTNFIKFGWVKNSFGLKHRTMLLQTGCPFKLKVLATLPGTLEQEQTLHQMLKGSHHRGEWFMLCSITRQAIELMKSGKSFTEWEINSRSPTRLRRILWWQAQLDKDDGLRLPTKSGYKWTYRPLTNDNHASRTTKPAGEIQPNKVSA